MESTWLLALAAALVGGLVALLVLRRGGAGRSAEIAELAGRLSQIAEGQAAVQSRIAEQLQAQERALAKALDEKLGTVSERLSQGLEKSSAQTQTTMTDLRERLTKIDEAQKNITELSTQVVSLQDILSNKQARGAFGEIQLKDLVESVLPPSAYDFQATIGNNKRVDCLLRLPNPPGPIAVDAKFPLEAYRALREARDEAARIQAGRDFSASILGHVRDIAKKYIVPGETAESALMFLPSEAVYAELHANFANVVEQSYRERVFIVSPTTLWATLNTIRAVLKDVRMREQAGVIQREVGVLLVDVGRLDKRVGKLQQHFGQATEDIRQIRISADKVTRRAEQIDGLQLEESEAAEPQLPPAPPRLVQD